MKQIWQGRMVQAASKYSELTPTATVCCYTCRACVTTNLTGLAIAGAAAVTTPVVRLARRLKPTSSRTRGVTAVRRVI